MELPKLGTEAFGRMINVLGQQEVPVAEKVGVEPLKVGGLERGMTRAPAIEVDGDLIVLKKVSNRLPAFSRCLAAASPKDSVVGDLGALDMAASGALEAADSVLEFRDATARMSTTAVLAPVEGGEQLVIYMARPGKETFFEELVPDFMEDDAERRAVLTDENGKPLAVVFGPKREKQAAPAAVATEAVTPLASEPEAPPIASPVPPFAEAPLPDWLDSLRSTVEPEPPAAPLAPEAPSETAPVPEAPSENVPAPVESEEERLARLDEQVKISEFEGNLTVEMDGQLYFGGKDTWTLQEILSAFGEARQRPLNERFNEGWTDENLDYAIAKLEAMKVAKEAAAGETAAAGTGAGGAERVEEAPPEPEAFSFVDRVGVARGTVARAAEDAGLLPGKIAEESRIVAERRQGLPELVVAEKEKTGIETPELSDEELEILKKAHEILVSHKSDPGMSTAEVMLRRNVLGLQEQYKLGREMAEAANKKYGAELGAAAKELTPGWFEKEPAVVREMAELQAFFERTGSTEELRRTITEIEEEKNSRAWKNGGINEKYRRKEEAALLQAQADLATLESADRFMARTDMPKILRAVIEAARAGREYPFGTGPVAEFRRRVYESVIAELGVEAVPAVEAVEAVAPAAPVETAEQIRQKVEKEFLGEDELDPAVSQAQTKLRESAVSGKANPKAVAEALAKQAEQNPGARKAVTAGAKQLAMDVLAEARRERDPKKRQKMLTWVKDFGVGFEATAMVGELGLGALDALISAIVNELGGQK